MILLERNSLNLLEEVYKDFSQLLVSLGDDRETQEADEEKFLIQYLFRLEIGTIEFFQPCEKIIQATLSEDSSFLSSVFNSSEKWMREIFFVLDPSYFNDRLCPVRKKLI